MAERRSTWHRFDVLRAVCDIARPQPAVDGNRWAQMLHAGIDTVLAECVDPDPADTSTRRRDSDERGDPYRRSRHRHPAMATPSQPPAKNAVSRHDRTDSPPQCAPTARTLTSSCDRLTMTGAGG